MGIFDDREKAQENKYFHDAELRFKAVSRRNKLFGAWVGEKLGKTGPGAEAYVQEVLKSDLSEAGDADMLGKVAGDLKSAGKPLPEKELKVRLEECLRTAIRQLEAEK
jgi:hypothetical protein